MSIKKVADGAAFVAIGAVKLVIILGLMVFGIAYLIFANAGDIIKAIPPIYYLYFAIMIIIGVWAEKRRKKIEARKELLKKAQAKRDAKTNLP